MSEEEKQAEEVKPKLEIPKEKLTIEKIGEKPGGIRILQRGEPEIEPPLKEGVEAEAEELGPAVKVAREGKIPISRGVVKPLLRFEGLLLAETTGYRPFLYTEEDLEDIWELVEQTGLEATPAVQVFLALGGLHAEKFAGWLMWKKQGKPEELSMKKEGKEER